MLTKSQKFKVLFKNQLIIFKNQKSNIIMFSAFVLIIFLLDIIGFVIISSKTSMESKFILINLFIIINSISILLGGIYFSLNILFSQITNGIHKLELKSGISIKQIFLSRVTFIFTLLTTLLVTNIIISAIFFLFFQLTNVEDILAYRFFISSMAWYAIWILMITSFTILMSFLLNKESLTALLSSLFGMILLVNIIISPLFNSSSNKETVSIRTTIETLFELEYASNLQKQIDNSEKLLEFKSQMEQSYYYSQVNQLMAGYKIWIEDLGEEEFSEFERLANNIEVTFKDYDDLEWTDVIGFSVSNNIFNENIKEVAKYGMENNVDPEYDELFSFVYNNSNNQGYYKSLHQGYIPDAYSIEIQQLYLRIQENYQPAEYLFTRFLLEKVYYSGQFSLIKNAIEMDTSEIIKQQRIRNIANPFNNVILMFHSIDYKNPVLSNMFSSSQYMFASTFNIDKNYDTDENNELVGTLKRDISVEVIYVIYALIFIGLIFIAYIQFKNRIYSF